MRRGTHTTIQVGGERFPATYLGRGHWSTAYLSEDGVTVYLYTRDDPMKEAASHAEGLHLPPIARHGYTVRRGIDYDIYSMPYYRNITPADKEAWAVMRELCRTREAVWRRDVSGHWPPRRYFLPEVSYNTIQEADVPDTVRESLESLYYWGCNYTSDLGMEYARRNIGVDAEGRIIFRDVLYDGERLRQPRRR
jgi:hypothetical protein